MASPGFQPLARPLPVPVLSQFNLATEDPSDCICTPPSSSSILLLHFLRSSLRNHNHDFSFIKQPSATIIPSACQDTKPSQDAYLPPLPRLDQLTRDEPRSGDIRTPPTKMAATAKSGAYKPFKPLTFTPIHFSLTEGTNIPAPAPEPIPNRAASTKKIAMPTTTNGTASPAFQANPTQPLTPLPQIEDSSRPFSASQDPMQSPPKRVSGLRKFLSLRSLRRLSSNNHDDPRANMSVAPSRQGHYADYDPVKDRQTPSAMSFFKSSSTPDYFSRPGSRMEPQRPGTAMGRYLHRKRSSGWFNSTPAGGRSATSNGWTVDENGMMVKTPEDGADAADGIKRQRGPPPPTIPEFRSLDTVMDEDMFNHIK